MELEVGTVIAGIDLVVGIAIVFLYVKILGSLTRQQLKGSTMYWASTLLFLTAFVYVIHAGIEVAGLGEGLYAVTGLVATILLGFTLVVIDIINQMLGVRT